MRKISKKIKTITKQIKKIRKMSGKIWKTRKKTAVQPGISKSRDWKEVSRHRGGNFDNFGRSKYIQLWGMRAKKLLLIGYI